MRRWRFRWGNREYPSGVCGYQLNSEAAPDGVGGAGERLQGDGAVAGSSRRSSAARLGFMRFAISALVMFPFFIACRTCLTQEGFLLIATSYFPSQNGSLWTALGEE